MSSSTLTSLAMLKVHIDQGQDYIDYLRPFILEVLIIHKPDPVTDKCVSDHIRGDFGLEIPPRVVQIVLKRLSRQLPIRRNDGVYRITGELPDQRIAQKKNIAERHIKAVLAGLRGISETTPKPITSDEEAVTAICTFLTQFSIPCLRAFLRGSTIPTIEDRQNAHIVLVSKYVMGLQSDPESSESFKVVIEGHMLANALLCPDLHNAPKSYRGTTFYLDTPLLVRRLDLVGNPHLENVKSLIMLLRNLGGKVAAFSHTREELEHVISGAASFIDSYQGRGGIVWEARRKGATKSDLLLLLTQIDEKLKDAGIEIVDTPQYIEDVQIDETVFEDFLDLI
ncbi:MAG: hypothetical protein ABIK45_15270 [Pseudomonadota bacterium]